MRTYRLEIILAALFAAVLLAFSWWQSPGKVLQPAEIEHYLARVEQGLPMAEDEKREILARLEAWGAADDGKPIYMLNVMRYFDELQALPGVVVDAATPREAHEKYMQSMVPLVVRLGMYPVYTGVAHGIGLKADNKSNLVTFRPEVDDWDEAAVIRYPSRRAFFELVSSPDYWRVMPLKTASLEVVLVPTIATLNLPDLRLLLGTIFLVLVLAIGWFRAARRNT